MAAASSAEAYGAWAYLAVFALMALTFAGVPAIGAALGAEVGPAAYGVGKVSASEQDAGSLAALLIGLAIAAGFALLAARYYRRRRAPHPPQWAASAPPRSAGNYPDVLRSPVTAGQSTPV